MQYQIMIEGSHEGFVCRSGESVLTAMCRASGSAIQVGCRGGGCGVCEVAVLAGSYDCGPMSSARISDSERARGRVLACQLIPRSDLALRPVRRGDGSGDSGLAALRQAMSRKAQAKAQQAWES